MLGRLLRDPSRPFVVVLGGAQGLRQDRRHPPHAHDRRHRAHRRRHGQHVPRRQGLPDRRVQGRRRRGGASRATSSPGPARRAAASSCPPTWWSPREAVAGSQARVAPADGIAADEMALDIGPQTTAEFVHQLRGAGTVYWNGPMGLFEIGEFAAGTKAVGEAIADGRGRHRGRRRRHRLGGAHVRAGGTSHPRVHGGRGFHGIPGGPGAARCGGAHGQGRGRGPRRAAARSWRATGRCTRRRRRRRSSSRRSGRWWPAWRTATCSSAPPDLDLLAALAGVVDTRIKVGAQTMHYAAEGAYTGETSPAMLVEVGVPYVILGHSERRQYYNENDADLAREGPRRARRRPASPSCAAARRSRSARAA